MSDKKRESPDGFSEPLAERGFRPVETVLSGDWASNVEMSIQITSKRDVDRRRTYVARVYNAPADSLELPRVQLLAEAQSDDHVEATRLALQGAEENQEERKMKTDEPDSTEETFQEFAYRRIDSGRTVTVVVVGGRERDPQHGEEESMQVAQLITPDDGRVVTLDSADEDVRGPEDTVDTFLYTLPKDAGWEDWREIREKISRQRLMQMNAVILAEDLPGQLLHVADAKAVVADDGGVESVRRLKLNPYEHDFYEIEMGGLK